MQLVCISLHQRNVSVEVREHLTFSDADLPAALATLQTYVAEGFILSTCNRVEVYAFDDNHKGVDQALLRFFADWHNISLDEIAPSIEIRTDIEAIRHIFHLAAGLDSMVLGETQIVNQIKHAMATAKDAGILGGVLRRLVDSALTAGKIARTRTGLARSHVSVVSVGLDFVQQTLGCLTGHRFLIIGAGRMGELALKHLHGEDVTIHVMSRTESRAAHVATRYGVESLSIEQLEVAMQSSDVIISCTSAPGYIISYDAMAEAVDARTQPLVIVDLAVPRDVDPHIQELSGVALIDVDGMQEICETNRSMRATEVQRAALLVEDEVQKFMDWWNAQQVVPTIRALRERAEAICEAEIERTLARLPELSAREQEAIRTLSSSIINKLLHQPIKTMKDPDLGLQFAQSVQQLFQLDTMREPHVIEPRKC
ncbi:MAG: hypothetical protein GFH25_541202n175 [Chloroflexi bacterium AL-N10]|nr:hypothetical protein [Chloroflexi bacterium AL-N1]NOK69207.1 hypothetical protein [Chloroflexi bacterium AL-N10]NOK77190.1 hypothetical protein [Chloroflexi bacterium AL-N5]NOK91045.1 hypothetical protein [Chloroflexi bacterium AL-N15]